MKKRLVNGLIFLLLISSSIVLAQSTEKNSSDNPPGFLEGFKNLFNSTDETGVFFYIKNKTSYYWTNTFDFVNKKIGWVAGTRTFEGDWTYITLDFWINRALFMLFLFIWMGIFFAFTTPTIEYNGEKFTPYEYYSLDEHANKKSFLKTWSLIFSEGIHKKYFVKSIKIWVIISTYLIVSLIPYLMRILEIITLETLGVNIILRTLIVATVISYGPFYINKYGEYRKRQKIYEEELEKVAVEEAMKARMR
ncbi:MAG: hypothetical protein ABIG28_02230 [archaeon]